MKRRAVFSLLFALFFSFTLSLSSSAADETGNEYVYDDYMSYLEHIYFDLRPGDIVAYKPYVDADGNVYDNSIELYGRAEPNYPDFDLSLINLDTIPDHIKNIIYSEAGGVMVRVWTKVYQVFVMQNGCFYHYSTQDVSSGSITRVSDFVGLGTSSLGYEGYETSSCYWAYYNLDGSINTNWTEFSLSAFPSPYYNADRAERDKRFNAEFGDANCDIYYMGNFPVKGGTASSMTVGGDSSNSTTMYMTNFSNKPSTSSDLIYISDSIQSFPTYESQELDTNKSIFQKLGDIPELIGDKLKSLFIPEDGYFDAYTEELRTYFEERFGLLIEIPSEVIGIIETLIEYEPETEVYKIDVPQINAGYIDGNGDFIEYTVIEEQEFVFDFLNEGAFATLYEFYRGFIWCVYVFMLINLILRKANKIFGGGSE